MERVRVGTIGGGAFGTSLCVHCSRAGHETLIYTRDEGVTADINNPQVKENKVYFKGFRLPGSLRASTNLLDVVAHADLLLLCVPTPYVAATLEKIRDHLQPHQVLVSCSKGILNETLETVDKILERVLPVSLHRRIAFLSGPSFAAEVAREKPTCVTIAARDLAVCKRVQMLLSTGRFRCYRTADVTGVELAGALKNVLAIGCGMVDGLDFGGNGRAALITRGHSEIVRLAVALGAHPLTLSGLAGIGDIVLTCTGDLSRNRTVGLRLGKGEALEDIIASMKAVAEGVLTSRSAHLLAQKVKISTPIIDAVYRIVHERADPLATLDQLMSMDLMPEVDEAVLAASTATHLLTESHDPA
ncbi:hypothetical protein WJX81_002728 [Elliptochloris bilobata]|uniref:Glycerol-3-phosphate dehydrogenase [NAD(+)] n=1 Tax=Elliptochloris bilobata TaxID=381761 RepID=A0AAW1SH83_9CHLO